MPPPKVLALPQRWTDTQIKADVATARAEFRYRRLGAPLADYATQYPTAKAAADIVVSALGTVLGLPADRALAASIVGNKEQFAALRSLAAVPISKDDLNTLLDASLSKTSIKNSQPLADGLASLLSSNLDPQRFPWVSANRAPTAAELEAAKLATAVLTAVSAVQAARRGDEREALEGEVAAVLNAAGYSEVPKLAGGILSLAQFPAPGTYMRQCKLGGHNADFVIRLLDSRLLPIECKASNSAVNGFKRLNKEVVVDAEDWYRTFGQATVVAGAALRGVFKADNVETAQGQNVFIFWWHNMAALADFLARAR